MEDCDHGGSACTHEVLLLEDAAACLSRCSRALLKNEDEWQGHVGRAAAGLFRAVQLALEQLQHGLGIVHQGLLAAGYNLAVAISKDPAIYPSQCTQSTEPTLVPAPLSRQAALQQPLHALLNVATTAVTLASAQYQPGGGADGEPLQQQLLRSLPPTLLCCTSLACITAALQQYVACCGLDLSVESVDASSDSGAASSTGPSEAVDDEVLATPFQGVQLLSSDGAGELIQHSTQPDCMRGCTFPARSPPRSPTQSAAACHLATELSGPRMPVGYAHRGNTGSSSGASSRPSTLPGTSSWHLSSSGAASTPRSSRPPSCDGGIHAHPSHGSCRLPEDGSPSRGSPSRGDVMMLAMPPVAPPCTAGHGVSNASELQAFKQGLISTQQPRQVLDSSRPAGATQQLLEADGEGEEEGPLPEHAHPLRILWSYASPPPPVPPLQQRWWHSMHKPFAAPAAAKPMTEPQAAEAGGMDAPFQNSLYIHSGPLPAASDGAQTAWWLPAKQPSMVCRLLLLGAALLHVVALAVNCYAVATFARRQGMHAMWAAGSGASSHAFAVILLAIAAAGVSWLCWMAWHIRRGSVPSSVVQAAQLQHTSLQWSSPTSPPPASQCAVTTQRELSPADTVKASAALPTPQRARAAAAGASVASPPCTLPLDRASPNSSAQPCAASGAPRLSFQVCSVLSAWCLHVFLWLPLVSTLVLPCQLLVVWMSSWQASRQHSDPVEGASNSVPTSPSNTVKWVAPGSSSSSRSSSCGGSPRPNRASTQRRLAAAGMAGSGRCLRMPKPCAVPVMELAFAKVYLQAALESVPCLVAAICALAAGVPSSHPGMEAERAALWLVLGCAAASGACTLGLLLACCCTGVSCTLLPRPQPGLPLYTERDEDLAVSPSYEVPLGLVTQ